MLWCGVHGLQSESSLTWYTMLCKGATGFYMILSIGCKVLSTLVLRTHPSPFSLTLVVAEVFFSLFFFFMFVCFVLFCAFFCPSLTQLLCNIFYPFLNMLSERHYQHHWLDQLWPEIQPAGSSCDWHRDSSWPVLKEATALLTKTLPCKPNTVVSHPTIFLELNEHIFPSHLSSEFSSAWSQ